MIATLRGREILVGERLKQGRDLGPWRRHLGDYRRFDGNAVEPTIATFKLGEAKGELFAQVAWADPTGDLGSTRLWLVPVSDEEAIVAGPLAGTREVIRRVASGGEPGLRYRGYVLKKVR